MIKIQNVCQFQWPLFPRFGYNNLLGCISIKVDTVVIDIILASIKNTSKVKIKFSHF